MGNNSKMKLKTFLDLELKAPEGSEFYTGRKWIVDGNVKKDSKGTVFTPTRISGDVARHSSIGQDKEFRAACEAFVLTLGW